MLEKTLQKKLLKNYQAQQGQRHQLIANSNDALRQAKQAIFHLHRDDAKGAKKSLQAVLAIFSKIEKTILKDSAALRNQGAYLAALEEFVEAHFFYQTMQGKNLQEIKAVKIAGEQYLGGLADLTGELTRQAVLKASVKDFKAVNHYAEIVQGIVGALIEFDLTGSLRQKYDDAKRNLKRIESILYDISLRQ